MATKSVVLTTEWQQVAGGDCVLQSPNFKGEVCLSVGAVGDDFLIVQLDEPCTFEFGQVVFARLGHGYLGASEKLVVIE